MNAGRKKCVLMEWFQAAANRCPTEIQTDAAENKTTANSMRYSTQDESEILNQDPPSNINKTVPSETKTKSWLVS